MTTTNIIIKLETMGLSSDSAIASIGATALGGKDNSDFYIELDWEEQDRHIDSDTKRWWKNQSSDVTKYLNGLDTLREGLIALSTWLGKQDNSRIVLWGGVSFDINILEHAYRQLYLPIPWKFYNVRDIGTLSSLNDMKNSHKKGKPVSPEKLLMSHHALTDAKRKSQLVKKCICSLIYK